MSFLLPVDITYLFVLFIEFFLMGLYLAFVIGFTILAIKLIKEWGKTTKQSRLIDRAMMYTHIATGYLYESTANPKDKTAMKNYRKYKELSKKEMMLYYKAVGLDV